MNRSARGAALATLLEFWERGYLPTKSDGLTDRDRRLTTTLVKGVFRFRPVLDNEIATHASRKPEEMDLAPLEMLRLGIFEILFLRTPSYAVVNEYVELARSYAENIAGMVNAVLRRVSERPATLPKTFGMTDLVPVPLADRWKQEMTKAQIRDATMALQGEPPLVLRTNITKTTPEKLLAELTAEGAKVRPAQYAPAAIYMDEGPLFSELRTFREGHFYIQNEAAQLASLLLAPEPDKYILDACSAPGGKATHIAELTGCKGRITCIDPNYFGMTRLKDNLRRLGLGTVYEILGSLEYPPPALKGPFDYILLDAPCSSWGILAEHPEWRWKKDANAPFKHADLQLKLLCRSYDLMRSGGVMVYSVCTFSKEETTKVVSKFIAECKGLTVEDPRPFLPDSAKSLASTEYVQTLPGQGALDGFFLARFRKK